MLIDRYILRQLISTLLFSLIALCLIFLIVNLMETLDDFIDHNAGILEIVEYYINFFPYILSIMTPVAMLLATLFTIGKLSTMNEITAMKSGGLSLYRLMIPLVLFSIVLSFAQLYFNGWIVPKANERKIELERVYLGKSSGGMGLYNIYFRDKPLRNVIMQYYDERTKSATRVTIEDYTSEKQPRISQRIETDRLIWSDDKHKWIARSGIIRYINNSKISSDRFDSLEISLNITHNKIIQLKRSPSEMNFDEIKQYIELLKMGGKDIRRQQIEYHGNYAFPFANFIVILFGVPFASVRKKGGLAIQIGAAMIISFLYLVFTKISQTIGFSAGLDEMLTGWLANILFFIFGLIVLLKTKT